MITRIQTRGVHIFVSLIAVTTSCVFAADRLVPSAYSTIQNALSAALSGDTIILSPGTYSGSGNSNLSLSNKPVTIRSTNPADPDIVASTIIDGFDSSAGSCPVFNNVSSKSTLTIDGITIANCYDNVGGAFEIMDSNLILRNCVFADCIAWENGGIIRAYHSNIKMESCKVIRSVAQGRGGVIYAENKSFVELFNCDFTDNWSMAGGGGALYIYDSNLTSVIGCKFTGNTALGAGSNLRGGAIYIERAVLKNDNLVIRNSDFTDNFASGYGGAIYSRNQPLVIKHSNFTANISQQSGGGVSFDSNLTLVNSVLAGNVSSAYGAAVDCQNASQNSTVVRNCTFADLPYSRGGAYFIRTCSKNISVTNSIFWNTTSRPFFFSYYQNLIFSYNNVQNGQFPTKNGVGNISIAPMFVQSGGWNNGTYTAGDYHIALESPMINAGDPNTITEPGEKDMDGNPRIRLGRIDIGAYEQGTHRMDFNEDGIVNFKDFAEFAEAWLWHRAGRN